MAEGDRPVVIFRVEYPAERLEVRVHRANADGSAGELLGTAFSQDKTAREVGDVGLAWDGTYLTTNTVPYLARASAGSYVLDREGRLRLFVRHNQGIDTLANDLSLLLDEKSKRG